MTALWLALLLCTLVHQLRGLHFFQKFWRSAGIAIVL